MPNKKRAKLLSKRFVTHDVKSFTIEKPEGYTFKPGQAAMVAVNKDEWIEEDRPFTFTSLNDDKVLELTIKEYSDHDGTTKEIHKMKPGEEFLIGSPWGAIKYKGPGVFLAGGAGITPFIAIFRQLKEDQELKGNRLIFSNRAKRDIILEKELREMFSGDDLILTLTDDREEGYDYGMIDKEFLEENISDFSQNFYVCGPPAMVEDISKYLKELGADPEAVIFEE